MKKKFMILTALSFGGGALFQGCLGGLDDFFIGLTKGWPAQNGVLNLAWDILNEELFG